MVLFVVGEGFERTGHDDAAEIPKGRPNHAGSLSSAPQAAAVHERPLHACDSRVLSSLVHSPLSLTALSADSSSGAWSSAPGAPCSAFKSRFSTMRPVPGVRR